MRILGVCGSLRRGSHNRSLLRAAALELPGSVELVVFGGLGDVPPYSEDDDGPTAPAGAARLRDAFAGADAILFATPEYNASVPGVLKNAVDWASRPFPGNSLRGRPVAVVGASTGLFGAVWAQAELRKVLTTAGASVVVEEELPVGRAHEAFDADGRLRDPALRAALARIVGTLVERAREPVRTAA